MRSDLSELLDFCQVDVAQFIASQKETVAYPRELVQRMADLGLFGVNIPAKFGGSKVTPMQNLILNRELAKIWLPLTALYGIHLRANQYFLGCANAQQKSDYLQALAQGKLKLTHAYHEKSLRNPLQFATQISLSDESGIVLNGSKDWVINAQHCDRILVIAKHLKEQAGQPKCAAIIVDPSLPGVEISDEHMRKGLEGISLARVTFNNVRVSESELIGGLQQCCYQTATAYQAMPLLSFAARCAGLATSLSSIVKNYLDLNRRSPQVKGIVAYKWSEIQMLQEAIVGSFEHCLQQQKSGTLSKPSMYRAKVFCAQTLNAMIDKVRALCGGSSFASHDYALLRQINDASLLSLVDTPNDILLSLAAEAEFAEPEFFTANSSLSDKNT